MSLPALNLLLGGLAILSGCLLVWQWLVARKFPLHRPTAPGPAPGISVLKPVKGCDATTRDSLESWFQQQYAGPMEIFVGVAEDTDPVCSLVRELIAQYPAVSARLVVCRGLIGANAKVAKLAQLERLAGHELILISDADVRVPPDFVAGFAAPMQDAETALVNCFYRLANPSTMAMRWEAVAINADFWSQVLQSLTLKPMDFALGAAILVRRRALQEIGGFGALRDCLADDYQLGWRIRQKGHHLALSTLVVECWDEPQTWKQVWKHQLRWARTIRISQPVPYFFSVLSNATWWPLLWLAGLLAFGTWSWPLAFPLCLVLLRVLLAQDLQRRFTPGRQLISPAWLVPLKDGLQMALWFSAFLGREIEWRGRRMRVRTDGTLAEVTGTR